MITCILLVLGRKARHGEGWKRGKEAHVKRLSKPARVVVEKRTTSRSRVSKVYAINEGSLWCGLLVHERF
jgi:hypothetical protein